MIKIASTCVEKIDYRSKANSVIFIDYTDIVQKIFDEFETDKEFLHFCYCLCTANWDRVKLKQYQNGYRIESDEIEITENKLGYCLPKKIRSKYFIYDKFYERFILKRDFINYIM